MPPAPGESFATNEEPDLIVWRLVGHVSADDIRHLYDAQVRFCEGRSHAFVLIDVHRLGHFAPEARRIAAQGPHDGKIVLPVRANAVVGASFHLRVLGIMVSRASALLNPAHAVPIQFFDTESEARAWIDDLRRDLR
ncbi:STAS/SEC14 domain-containing protein [Polyangium spumosum]|nr:STAS/SEC14 domain-containing protein [Polyangium spumosum]